MASKKKTQDKEAIHNAFYGVLSFAAAYGFASWAIDSGSLIVYALAFTSLYFAFRYTHQAIRTVFAHDTTRKKPRAKKA